MNWKNFNVTKPEENRPLVIHCQIKRYDGSDGSFFIIGEAKPLWDDASEIALFAANSPVFTREYSLSKNYFADESVFHWDYIQPPPELNE